MAEIILKPFTKPINCPVELHLKTSTGSHIQMDIFKYIKYRVNK